MNEHQIVLILDPETYCVLQLFDLQSSDIVCFKFIDFISLFFIILDYLAYIMGLCPYYLVVLSHDLRETYEICIMQTHEIGIILKLYCVL